MKSVSIEAQRCRLLDALRGSTGGLSTIALRERYNIISPAPRVYELRHNDNHNIQTIRRKDVDSQGFEHSVANYIPAKGNWKDGANE